VGGEREDCIHRDVLEISSTSERGGCRKGWEAEKAENARPVREGPVERVLKTGTHEHWGL